MAIFSDSNEVQGSDLLAELDDHIARIGAQANDRNDVVEQRIQTLEAEQADLKQVQRRIQSTKVA